MGDVNMFHSSGPSSSGRGVVAVARSNKLLQVTAAASTMLVVVAPMFFLLLTNGVSGFGIVDYNDECEFDIVDYSTFQTRFDQSKFCDTARGLYCIPGLGKCGCQMPHTIYRAGKCRAKIGNGCLAPGNIRLDCVEHARCTNNNTSSQTFKCQCIRGYLSNAMQTSCFPVGYYDRRNSAYGTRSRYYNNDPRYLNGATSQLPTSTQTILLSIAVSALFLLKSKLIS